MTDREWREMTAKRFGTKARLVVRKWSKEYMLLRKTNVWIAEKDDPQGVDHGIFSETKKEE